MKSKHKILLHETSNKILIYTGHMSYLWNDSTLKTSALGGSEKAVIYLSRFFPKNYKIYIAGDTLEEEFDNIKYVNHANLQSLLDTEKFHTIIISRYISFLEKYNNYKCFQLVLSAHDTIFHNYPNDSNDTDNTLKTFIGIVDYVVCLTEWHKNILIEHYNSIKDANFKIINNGINLLNFDSEMLNNITKIKNKFVWSSCSDRGLNILLKLWPSILEKLPDATLDICSYQDFPSDDRDLDIKKIIDNYDSIIHHGKLQTDQLYKLLKKSEYWLYTNTFPETSCITAMEMLNSFVICIYYPSAGLVETIGDYGIKVNTGTEIETILKLSEEDKAMFHKKVKEYAFNCSWELRAQEWSRILNLNNTKKIAIFNSFCFHYEMYGYIIEYCKINNFILTIYTSFDNTLGWLEFYKNKFQNYQFKIKSVLNFENENEREMFDIVFITTDDDYFFKEEWITSKCVAIQHTYNIRRKEFLNNLCTRRFLNFSENENENERENENKHYAIPSFTIFEKNEKENNKMLIKSIQDLNDDSLKQICATDIRALFEEEIKKASEKFAEEQSAKDSVIAETEKTKVELENQLEELKQVGEQLKAELEKIKIEAQARDLEETFQNRMTTLDEEFDLDDEERLVIGEQIKNLDTDSFEKWYKAFNVFAKNKNKKMMVDKKAADQKMKEEKEGCASSEKNESAEVIASEQEKKEHEAALVLEKVEAEEVALPNGAVAEDTLRQRFAKAFNSDTIKIEVNK